MERAVIGVTCEARDAEERWRKATITAERVVDLGDRTLTLYRAEFNIGGSRWVRADETRERVRA
jgi:hypothetical protein